MPSKENIFGLAIILIGLLLSGCGPSPEEQTATAVALTAAAATDTPTPTLTPSPTPTSTPTPTPTPIPYDLSLVVIDENDIPIEGASVNLFVAESDEGIQTTDDSGQTTWTNLPGETVNLSIGAQGYFPIEVSETIERGPNQLNVVLERDPFGLLPSEACAPGERLLYIEDLQDGEAQQWPSIELRANGWNVETHPDTPGNIVISRLGEFEGGALFHGQTFDNAVWRLRFMPVGRPIFNFAWHLADAYEVDEGAVEWSSYAIWFHPPRINVFREQPPLSTVILREIERTMRSGEWHRLEIGTYEGVLEIWIDGVRFVTYEDPKPLPEGAIILGVGFGEALDPQSIIYYDDLVVCELTSPFVPMPTPESES